MQNIYRTRRTPYGFGFRDVRETNALEEKSRLCQKILKEENYERIMPAMVDFPETFYGSAQDDVFKMRDHLGYDLSLRSDITTQVIKGFANQLEQKQGVRKFYYYGSVFHDVSRNYPSDREIYQMGAEYIGGNSTEGIEKLALVAGRILKEVFQLDAVMAIGDIRIIHVLETFAGQKIDKLVLLQRNAVALAAMLAQKGELSAALSEKLSRHLFFMPASEQEAAARWSALAVQLPAKLVSDLNQVMQLPARLVANLRTAGLPAVIEPLLYRDSAYYTGLIFSAFVQGLSHSPVRGGVYDELVSRYSNKQMPACGFAADISTLVRLAG